MDNILFDDMKPKTLPTTVCYDTDDHGIVSRLIDRNVLNIDGSIDVSSYALERVSKHELWNYFIYLYNNNNDLEVFSQTHKLQSRIRDFLQSRGVELATLIPGEQLGKNDLLAFFRLVFAEFGPQIRVPILENMYVRILKEESNKLKDLNNKNDDLQKRIDDMIQHVSLLEEKYNESQKKIT